MRMWMVNPELLCNQHLLGEHVECHMFVGHLLKKRKVTNYINFNLFQPKSLNERHEQLASEMAKRGMNHRSPLKEFDLSYLPQEQIDHEVNVNESQRELLKRCPRCRKRYEEIK